MNKSLLILLDILTIMAKLRSITEDQAVRLFPVYGKAAVEDVPSKAVKTKYIARKMLSIPAPTDAKVWLTSEDLGGGLGFISVFGGHKEPHRFGLSYMIAISNRIKSSAG